MAQFLLKLLFKQRILARFLVATKLLTAKFYSRYVKESGVGVSFVVRNLGSWEPEL